MEKFRTVCQTINQFQVFDDRRKIKMLQNILLGEERKPFNSCHLNSLYHSSVTLYFVKQECRTFQYVTLKYNVSNNDTLNKKSQFEDTLFTCKEKIVLLLVVQHMEARSTYF